MDRLHELVRSQEQRVRNRKQMEWIDTDEVCKMLGLGRRTVHSMRERGELPYSKLEHKIYYKTEDIVRKMDAHHASGSRAENTIQNH